jgi:predicted MFS family arabinose efflux permease
VFFVNVPFGVLAVLMALRSVPESRAEVETRSYDLGGAVTVTGGLVVLVYGIVKAQSYGWGSARSLITFAIAIALLVAFVATEARVKQPLMRLGVFRIRSLTIADVALLFVSAGLFGMFYFASLYVQEILGYSPIKAGLAFLPVTGGIILGSGAGQALISRFGVRGVAAVGATIGGIGLLVLTRLPVHGSYAADLLTGLIPLSIGLGLAFVPLTLMATSGIGNEDSGLASGLFNVAQQVGGSLGLAILSTLAASQSSSLIHVGTTAAGRVSATVSGYHVAFLVAAIMLFAAAGFLVFALRKAHLTQVEAEVREAGGAVPVAA